MNTPNEIKVPSWIFDHPGELFLLTVDDEGNADPDGGHSEIEDIVRARKLMKGIFGTKYGDKFYAVQILEIPDMDVPVNDEAMNLMGKLVNNEHLESD